MGIVSRSSMTSAPIAPRSLRSNAGACLFVLVPASALLTAGCHEGIGMGAWIPPRALSAPSSAADGPPELAEADGSLSARVEDALLADTGLQGQILHADAERGHVTLRGHVYASSLRDRAVQIAESVPGVVAVEDLIEVRPESAGQAEPLLPARRSWSGRAER